MQTLTFQNPNPATGTPGTLVTTEWFQSVNDEIGNVITGNGATLSDSNNQLLTVLNDTYATLASPIFTGTPLCPDTTSASNGKAIVNFESMQSYVTSGELGYTPVHQGGGTGQGSNTVYVGWLTDGSGLGVTVDSTDLGVVAFESWTTSAISSEATTRANADTALSTSIANETSARESAITSLTSSISAETSAREAAISSEASARSAADASLSTTIATYVSGGSTGSGAYRGETLYMADNGNPSFAYDGGTTQLALLSQIVPNAIRGEASGLRIEYGTSSTVAADAVVSFKTTFSGDPVVIVQNNGGGDDNCHAYNVTNTGFTLHINGGGSSGIQYIAIGPN